MAYVQVVMSDQEKAALEAQAQAEGVSTSLLAYRRIWNKPDAQRRAGRKPAHSTPSDDEGLWAAS